MNFDSSRPRARRASEPQPAAPIDAPLEPIEPIDAQAESTPPAAGAPPVPRQTAREASREAVRQAIFEAAEELIAEHGLHDAVLHQIAKRAGVAVGTLYNYFTDRDALIRGLFESRRETFRPRLLAAIHTGGALGFEPRLRQFVRQVLEAFESHRRFLKIAIENEHGKPPGSTTQQDLLAGARDIAAAGVRDGSIAADKAELFALIVSGTFRAVAMDRLHSGAGLASDADAIVDILLAGIRSAR